MRKLSNFRVLTAAILLLISTIITNAEDYYLIGGFNDWKLADAACKFEPTGMSGIYSVKVPSLTSDFKINNGSWTTGNTIIGANSANPTLTPGTPYYYAMTESRYHAIKMNVTATNATVYLNVNQRYIYVNAESETAKTVGWDVFGDFSGNGVWTGILLQNVTGTIWESKPVSISGNARFGMRQLADGNQDSWYASATPGVTLSESNPSVKVSGGAVTDFNYNLDGRYIFTFDTSTMILTVHKAPEVTIPDNLYLLTGSSSTQADYKASLMNKESDGVFSATGVSLGDANSYGYVLFSSDDPSQGTVAAYYYPAPRNGVELNLDDEGKAVEPTASSETYGGYWVAPGGVYDISVNIPEGYATFVCTDRLQESEYDVPSALYILGGVDRQQWSPSQGTPMAYVGKGIFMYHGPDIETFSFSTAILGEGNNNWAELNNQNVRWGAPGTTDMDIPADTPKDMVQAVSPMAYKAQPKGEYTVQVDWPNKTVTLIGITLTGVEEISVGTPETDAEAPVEYYTLGGVRVDRPGTGIYIERRGSTACKKFFRE